MAPLRRLRRGRIADAPDATRFSAAGVPLMNASICRSISALRCASEAGVAMSYARPGADGHAGGRRAEPRVVRRFQENSVRRHDFQAGVP
ncbi:hypothetical protein WT53_26545 [Burkholderia sp. MSMB2157WGS]|nr:hypothetical protein WT53_26545 [Burkholderia sp. MSMB2157WGS]